MERHKKLKILKAIKILLLVAFVPALLFYLGIVVPEYLACINCNADGAMGVDIWGNKVQCFGETKDISTSFFQFTSLIIAAFLVTLSTVFYFIYLLKRTL